MMGMETQAQPTSLPRVNKGPGKRNSKLGSYLLVGFLKV
jgi:hypothetical protein